MITLPLNFSGSAEISETQLGPFTKLLVTLARATSADPGQWADTATAVTVDLQVSDDGVTFREGGSFSAAGGIHVDKQGVEMPSTVVKFSYPLALVAVRGKITATNGPLVTTLTMAGG